MALCTVTRRTLCIAILLGVTSPLEAGTGAPVGVSERPWPVTEIRTDCTAYAPLRKPFFGDTHVHTTFSQDASTQDTRATPRDAYAFARGASLGIQPYTESGSPRRTVQLHRPLDFTVVTDHAEQLGETHICKTPGAQG
ncbi:MAG TPA: DUF3604 domain-containing protein, partial [Myxococcales bacterium]|nr:DUF3604 domain-containing protein [Myxococcales bacterium]